MPMQGEGRTSILRRSGLRAAWLLLAVAGGLPGPVTAEERRGWDVSTGFGLGQTRTFHSETDWPGTLGAGAGPAGRLGGDVRFRRGWLALQLDGSYWKGSGHKEGDAPGMWTAYQGTPRLTEDYRLSDATFGAHALGITSGRRLQFSLGMGLTLHSLGQSYREQVDYPRRIAPPAPPRQEVRSSPRSGGSTRLTKVGLALTTGVEARLTRRVSLVLGARSDILESLHLEDDGAPASPVTFTCYELVDGRRGRSVPCPTASSALVSWFAGFRVGLNSASRK